MDPQTRTLQDIFSDLWRARWFVLGGLGLAGLAAAAFLFFSTPYYQARMILSPATPMNGAEASDILTGDHLSALNYLVQRSGIANSSDFLRFENTYNGASVASVLLRDEKIAAGLAQDRRFSFSRSRAGWTAEELAEYIARNVRLEPVGATSLRRLVYKHPDRMFASYFLGLIHRVTDELIRRQVRQDTALRADYLQDTMRTTNNPEHRRALTALLMEQERLKMLVSLESPYAAAIVEPAVASVKPVAPQPLLIIPVFLFAGGLWGFVLSGFAGRNRSLGFYSAQLRRWDDILRMEGGNMNEKRGKAQPRYRRPGAG